MLKKVKNYIKKNKFRFFINLEFIQFLWRLFSIKSLLLLKFLIKLLSYIAAKNELLKLKDFFRLKYIEAMIFNVLIKACIRQDSNEFKLLLRRLCIINREFQNKIFSPTLPFNSDLQLFSFDFHLQIFQTTPAEPQSDSERNAGN